MKSVLMTVAAGFAVSSISLAAQAEIRSPISWIESVQFDGKNLTVGYYTGGGCTAHHGDIQLDFDATTQTVTARVFDVTETEDICQALLHFNATMPLRDRVKALMKEKGLTSGQVKLVLPDVKVMTY